MRSPRKIDQQRRRRIQSERYVRGLNPLNRFSETRRIKPLSKARQTPGNQY
jgi:hypothetical protein